MRVGEDPALPRDGLHPVSHHPTNLCHRGRHTLAWSPPSPRSHGSRVTNAGEQRCPSLPSEPTSPESGSASGKPSILLPPVRGDLRRKSRELKIQHWGSSNAWNVTTCSGQEADPRLRHRHYFCKAYFKRDKISLSWREAGRRWAVPAEKICKKINECSFPFQQRQGRRPLRQRRGGAGCRQPGWARPEAPHHHRPQRPQHPSKFRYQQPQERLPEPLSSTTAEGSTQISSHPRRAFLIFLPP